MVNQVDKGWRGGKVWALNKKNRRVNLFEHNSYLFGWLGEIITIGDRVEAERGDVGEIGWPGLQGPDGNSGPDGYPGLPGLDGENGEAGLDGLPVS